MNREIRPILAIAAVVAVIVLGVLALRPGTSETVVLPTVEVPPPGSVGPDGDPVAMVVSVRTEQETSLFGILRGKTHHIASVQFYAPAECVGAIESDTAWPLDSPSCQVEVSIAGTVSGTGVTPTGEAIVVVDVEISEACYSAVTPSDYWPFSGESCS